MTTKLKTTVELEVEVIGGVDFPVQPRGWDPGDPGGCDIEAVLLKLPHSNAEVDILAYLPEATVRELEEQLQVAAEEQAMDAYNAAMEAKYDAMKEGE
jgi:hypothetical protein